MAIPKASSAPSGVAAKLVELPAEAPKLAAAPKPGSIDTVEKARDAALTDFLRSAGDVDDRLEGKIRKALDGFSPQQLDLMRKGGVRIMNANEMPKDVTDAIEANARPQGFLNNGRYFHEIHVVQLKPQASADDIRHELAHALDDVKNDKKLVRLDDVKSNDKRADIISARHDDGDALRSKSEAKVETMVDGKPTKMTIKEMYAAFKERAKDRHETFENSGTADGYPTRSAHEFYAEGYSVFHGTNATAKEKLEAMAPELYAHFEMEAAAEAKKKK